MITFTADGKDYKLEVTAATLKRMERAGVNFATMDSKLTAPEILWKGMFIAHHDNVPDKTRMEIYHALSRAMDGEEIEYDEDGEPIDALMSAVGEEYKSALDSLKRGAGNLTWKRT